MRILLSFVIAWIAVVAHAAVAPIKYTDFPRTNLIGSKDLILIAVTNQVPTTNYHLWWQDVLNQISNQVSVIVSNTPGTAGESLLTNRFGWVGLIVGATNSLKFSTNDFGMIIGDTNRASSYFGWPSSGLTYINVMDGSSGHTLNRVFPAAVVDSTTNGAYVTFFTLSGSSPIFAQSQVVLTNGVVASEFDVQLQKTGGYLLLRDAANDSFVGLQSGGQLSVDIGPNQIHTQWGGSDRMLLNTNGSVTFFGSLTNYGILWAKSNLNVSGTTLLQGTVVGNGAALFLESVFANEGIYSNGATNTGNFQTLGNIALGNSSSDLTTSSNTFRQYGPMHIHNGGLFFQDVGIAANRLMFLTAGRLASTISTVDSTEAGFLDGVTSPISSLVNNPGVVTNIIGVGVGVSSNGGNWTITASGAGNPNTATNISGAGTVTVTSNNIGGWTITGAAGAAGSGSMWTNQSDLSILRPIAGSTNFIGGGTGNVIATNNSYSTVSGGQANEIRSNATYAAIGGGLQNIVAPFSIAPAISGGRQNTASTNYVSIGGGFQNTAGGRYTSIGGGFQNTAAKEASFIGGGDNNQADGEHATIGGGFANVISLTGTDGGGTISGGYQNSVGQDFGVVAGGAFNVNGLAKSAIGGGFANFITGNAASGNTGHAVISGGQSNRVGFTDGITPSRWSTIGGGAHNWVRERGEYSTIGGGLFNWIEGGLGVGGTIAGGASNLTLTGSSYVTVGGGFGNTIAAGAPSSTIAGGTLNTISTNSTHATVGGGRFNTVQDSALYSAILGGSNNIVTRHSSLSVIGGGINNLVNTNADWASILGGFENTIGSGANNGVLPSHYGSIGGGRRNVIASPFAVIGGGEDNVIEGDPTRAGYQTIAGGHGNAIGADGVTANLTAYDATIGGGSGNNIQYGAEGGTIAGGVGNAIRIGNTNAVIAGGNLNAIVNAPFGGILGGEKNILGSISPSQSAERSFVIGSGITVTNPYTVGIGYTNNSMVLINKSNLHLSGTMQLQMTNEAGEGKVFTSDSLGRARWAAGGGGGGGAGSGTYINSSNGFGTNTAFYGRVGIGTNAPNFKLELVGTAVEDRKIGINGMQVLYLPDQSVYPGSIFVGGGGQLQTHTLSEDGLYNTGIGVASLLSNVTGDRNTAIGEEALRNNTTGSGNSAGGYGAMYFNTVGNFNTAFGRTALYFNTVGSENSAFGRYSLYNNTNGIRNTGLGHQSMYQNLSGNDNFGAGWKALYGNTVGSANTGAGVSSLQVNTNGNYNSAFGFETLTSNQSGDFNSAFGYSTLVSLTTGVQSSGFGANSLYEVTTGIRNTAVGYNSGRGITTGSGNTIIGANVTGLAAALSYNIIIADGLGNQRINVDSSGNVGLGTNASAAKLHVTADNSIPLILQVGTTNRPSLMTLNTNGLLTVQSGLTLGPSGAVITNTLYGAGTLDFPSTIAGSSSDLPITVTGCTSNNCHVSLCVPWQAASGGGIFTHYESNDVVYIRFSNNQLTLAIDPTPAVFSALAFRVQ